MAASAANSPKTAKSNEANIFKTSLGNDEFFMEFETEKCQLKIEVTNAPRFVVHREIISKPEEVRHITGKNPFTH